MALVLLVLVHCRRASAHKAHIAAQYIKKLRQLVNARLADELAHLGHAGVVLHLEHQAVHLVLGHQLLFALLGVHVHAAQLVDVEVPSVAAHALLLEEERPGAFDLEGDRHDRNDRNAEDAAHQTAHDVHAPLGDLVAQLQFHGAHRHDAAPRAAAQRAAQPCSARLITAGLLDPVKQRQAEMHGQAHALHLLQIGDEALAAVHRHIDIDLVQRLAPDPVHKIGKARLHRNAIDLGADDLMRGLQQRHADNAAGPVLADLIDEAVGAVGGRHDADQTLHAPAALEMEQQPLERTVRERQQQSVDERHRHRKIAGVEHRCLGQQHQGRVDDAEHQVEFERELYLGTGAAGDDVLGLVKAEKGRNKGQRQRAERLHPVPCGVGHQHIEQSVSDQPRQQNTDRQGQQIRQEHIGVLHLFAFCNDVQLQIPFILSVQNHISRAAGLRLSVPAYKSCTILPHQAPLFNRKRHPAAENGDFRHNS